METEAGAAKLPRLGPLYLTLGIVAMSNTILASALPTVSAELSSTGDYTAIVTAYLLPKALATPIGGRMVDAFRPKTVVLWFTVLYILTTLACGMAQSMDQLLALRVLQGIGGGGLLASVYVVIDLLVPPRFQGRVQARVSMVFGGGAAAAPLVGGAITQYLGWRWCFFANLPALLVCLYELTRLPALEPRGKLSIDWKGAVFLTLFSCPLLLALTWGGVKFPWTAPQSLGLLALSVASGVLFWRTEKQPEEPLFDPELARGAVLRWSFLACFAVGGAFLGSLLFQPLFITVVESTGQTLAGLSMLPFIIGSIAGSVYGGGRVEDTGRYQRLAVVAGAVCCVTSLLLYALLTFHYQVVIFFLLQIVLAFAFGVAQDIYGIAVQNDTVASRQGMTGSALEFVRQLGSALGLSLVGTIFLLSLGRVMPREMDRWLSPLDIHVQTSSLEDPTHLEELRNQILKRLIHVASASADGEESAYRRLLQSPILTPELKESLRPGHHKELDAETTRELKDVAERADEALMESLRASVMAAQAKVYLLSALLCFLALLATLKLPDKELLSKLKEEDS